MEILIKSFTMVFFAEMGDKSQIMAMSFAAKYPLKKVAAGIFIGIAINHGLAVAFGYLLGRMLPINLIGLVAGVLFLYFGFSAFKIEEEAPEEEGAKMGFSVVQTIALAFFLGEFGDKTQLTATALASTAAWPLIVFAGTFSAMLVTSALGIALGSLLGKQMPEHLIKAASGLVFILFGTQKLFDLVSFLQRPLVAVIYGLAMILGCYISLRPLYRDWHSGRLSPMQRAAEHLKHMQHELKQLANGLCIGTEGQGGCGVCAGSGCIVGQMKILIEALDHDAETDVNLALAQLDTVIDKNFNSVMAESGLDLLAEYKSSHLAMYTHYQRSLAPIEARLLKLSGIHSVR